MERSQSTHLCDRSITSLPSPSPPSYQQLFWLSSSSVLARSPLASEQVVREDGTEASPCLQEACWQDPGFVDRDGPEGCRQEEAR
eukprot:8279739-Alexandrium_andersonii.AAC.1